MSNLYMLYSYTIQDKFGTKTQAVVPALVDDTVSLELEDVVGEYLTLGANIDAITDGEILGGRITMILEPGDGWKTTPGSNSFVERSGIFNFFNDTTRYKYGIKIPSIAEAVLTAGKIDLSNADVTTFIDQLTAAMGVGTGHWVNTGLHVLTALADAFLSVRKYRKQLDRSSYEPGA